VAELATGVALHGLSLAVTGEVVGATALVASGGAGIALEAAAEALEATAGASGTASAGGSGVGAVALERSACECRHEAKVSTYSKVAGLTAVVAAAVGTTVQAQGGAISLDVTEALAVVALLSCRELERSVLNTGEGALLSVVRGRGQALDSCPVFNV
jgi:hypothetical protein